ncbi:MAG: hypothetical protein AAF907_12170, partial [Planctomycetota bacterium]
VESYLASDAGPVGGKRSEWEDGWIGLRAWSHRYGGRGALRWFGVSVPVWLLLGAGAATGAGLSLWRDRAGGSNSLRNDTKPASPRRRLVVGIGRVWLWSLAALGGALCVCPHPATSGWQRGLWLEHLAVSPLDEGGAPTLLAGTDANDSRRVVPWRWLAAVPALGVLIAVGRFLAAAGSQDAGPAKESAKSRARSAAVPGVADTGSAESTPSPASSPTRS